MSKEWIGEAGARLIKHHQGKRRPAWLWEADGQNLFWRNDAARLFFAQYKKHRPAKNRLRLAKDATPIKGQVRRLLRLGSMGITGLARVRFLIGTKPVSSTCSCTPLELADAQVGLLIVGVDKIPHKFFKYLPQPDPIFTGRDKPDATDNQQRPSSSRNASDQDKGTLSQLMDRLDAHSSLYDPLTDNEEFDVQQFETKEFSIQESDTQSLEHKTPSANDVSNPPTQELLSSDAQTSFAREIEDNTETKTPNEATYQWRVIGREFLKNDDKSTLDAPFEADFAGENVAGDGQHHALSPDSADGQQTEINEDEDVERVAKYNFEELGKILKEKTTSNSNDTFVAGENDRRGVLQSRREIDDINVNNMINLSEEILVLNRLPVGILIFRDQNILFANKAMAELTGSPSISELKANGLEAIFPRTENNTGPVVPALHIVDNNGLEVPVETRLQSINWQDSPALMLWAQQSPATQGADRNARAFVSDLADARHQGYFEIDPNGKVTVISERGAELLQTSRLDMLEQPLTNFIHQDDRKKFADFLEHDIKPSEERPAFFHVRAITEPLTFELFTREKAGIVTGYFGSIEEQDEAALTSTTTKSEIATLVLGRLSRGIRQPLNTILGFSGLIRSEAFGEIENKRYVDYARDIEKAGGDIAQLADEMDEYAHLEDRDYTPDSTSFDMAHLLDECMGLVRNQANVAQVLVRSAVPDDLPFVMADRGSLRQAILNLLASAIAQTSVGKKVILSAQVEDDGSVGVHVRDSSSGPSGVDERFVVFREQDKRGGEAMLALPSSLGLTLTRSLIAVNACTLHVDPSAGTGTLMSLIIPAELLTAPV